MKSHRIQTIAAIPEVEFAAEIKIRAERRAGELLREMDKNKLGYAGFYEDDAPSTLKGAQDTPPTYADMSISYSSAHRWQKMAEVPEAKAKGDELTTASIYRLGRSAQTWNTLRQMEKNKGGYTRFYENDARSRVEPAQNTSTYI